MTAAGNRELINESQIISISHHTISYPCCFLLLSEKIRSKPIFQSLQNLTEIVGSDVVVLCDAADLLPPEFHLFKNVGGKRIRIDQNLTVKFKDGGSHGGNTRWWIAEWKLLNVSFDDEMFYTCTAKNYVGTNEKSFYIAVLPKRKSILQVHP